MIHRLAAIKLVRELELEVSALSFKGLEDVSERETILRNEIVSISCEIGNTKYKVTPSDKCSWRIRFREIFSLNILFLTKLMIKCCDGTIFSLFYIFVCQLFLVQLLLTSYTRLETFGYQNFQVKAY